MTLEELKNMKEAFLTASQVASILRMDTSRLIGYAKEDMERRKRGEPEQLPFPVVISGNRVKFPRLAFMKHYGLIEEEREDAGKLDEILKEIHSLNVALGGTNLILMSLLRHLSQDGFEEVDRIFKTMEGKKQ